MSSTTGRKSGHAMAKPNLDSTRFPSHLLKKKKALPNLGGTRGLCDSVPEDQKSFVVANGSDDEVLCANASVDRYGPGSNSTADNTSSLKNIDIKLPELGDFQVQPAIEPTVRKHGQLLLEELFTVVASSAYISSTCVPWQEMAAVLSNRLSSLSLEIFDIASSSMTNQTLSAASAKHDYPNQSVTSTGAHSVGHERSPHDSHLHSYSLKKAEASGHCNLEFHGKRWDDESAAMNEDSPAGREDGASCGIQIEMPCDDNQTYMYKGEDHFNAESVAHLDLEKFKPKPNKRSAHFNPEKSKPLPNKRNMSRPCYPEASVRIKADGAVSFTYDKYIQYCLKNPKRDDKSPFVTVSGFHCSYEQFRKSLEPGGRVIDDVMCVFAQLFNIDSKDTHGNKICFSTFLGRKLIQRSDEFDLNSVKRELLKVNEVFKIDQADQLFFPICEDEHWFLICVNILHKMVHFFTSCAIPSGERRDILIRNLLANMQSSCKVAGIFHEPLKTYFKRFPTCPQQNNGYDCGIYVMLFVENFDGVTLKNFSSFDADEFRKIVAHRLISHSKDAGNKIKKNSKDAGNKIQKNSKDAKR